MSPTNTITPPDIDEGIRQFCSELAPGHVPVYVDVAPYKDHGNAIIVPSDGRTRLPIGGRSVEFAVL
jgi:hypothetical protein